MPLVYTLNGQYDDSSLIRLAGVSSVLLFAPLIIAAAMSQFSAEVADTVAAIGNMEDITHQQMKARRGIVLVGVGALALTWSASPPSRIGVLVLYGNNLVYR